VVVGGVDDPDKVGALLSRLFGEGPVVVGPLVGDLLLAHVSARAAVAGLRAAAGWPAAPDVITSGDVLAERALDGDLSAHEELVSDMYTPVKDAGGDILLTLTAFLDHGGSIEGTARALFVHPNTVRYRLKRVAEVTGLTPSDPRHAFTLRIALTLGRLSEEAAPAAPTL
jgi:DNA-binding PucR family transcriptional regulator